MNIFKMILRDLAHFIIIFLLACFLPVSDGYSNPLEADPAASGLIVTELRCEFRENPKGIGALRPLLSFVSEALNAGDRDQFQRAYCIEVATDEKLLESGLPDLWNSGKVYGSASNNIPYSGLPLQSGMICFWRVKVWDRHGIGSAWSKPACWTMGLLHPSDWEGQWIKDSKPYPLEDSLMYGDLPAPQFRREFELTKRIKRAVLYISGLGYYEVSMNGHRLGRQLLDPGWSIYSKRIFYSTYDVTESLEAGRNCTGVILGNGWYNPLPMVMWGFLNLRETQPAVGQPQFIAQLNIVYVDDTRVSIFSDLDWKVADGPVVRNNIYLGEKYDARKELAGWDSPGFNGEMRKVTLSRKILGTLESQPQPPIVVGDTLRPVKIIKRSAGSFMVDFGRNFAGIVRLRASGESGRTITLRYGELLYPDGRLNIMTTVAGQVHGRHSGGPGAPDTAYQGDIFILKGGTEVFQPRFTFHGFRYVEIEGYPGNLDSRDIEGLVMHADVETIGSFTCSDTMINRIQQACKNTFLSNLFSIQSDCPGRERFGHGGDMQVTSEAYMNNFNMSGFYRKAVQDFADIARPGGGLTEAAPFQGLMGRNDFLGDYSGPIEWGSAHPVLLYHLYLYYGNLNLVREQYPVVKKWVDFLTLQRKKIYVTFGDWLSVESSPDSVSAASFYYYNTKLLVYFARLLKKEEDVKKYTALAADIKRDFIRSFDPEHNGRVSNRSQTAQAYAIHFSLLPDQEYASALAELLYNIKVKHQGHLATGMFGTKYMPEVLSNAGYGQVVYEMIKKETYPGWGYMISRGATSIWESWNFDENLSHNHPMFGVISEWLYRHLAGIRPDPEAVAFRKIIIRPDIIPALKWVKASYQSLYGAITSEWHYEGDRFYLSISIPANTTATVSLPAEDISTILESGRNIKQNKDIRFVKMEKHYAVFQVGSGQYAFESRYRRD
jgi:alpha-L-rhamnosidase